MKNAVLMNRFIKLDSVMTCPPRFIGGSELTEFKKLGPLCYLSKQELRTHPNEV